MTACDEVLKSAPHFQIPGLSEQESINAVCRVAEHLERARVGGGDGALLSETNGQPNPKAIADAVMVIRRTRFPGFADSAVVGSDGRQQIGLQHIISADNAAAYWELWHQGGNWYAVTGADPNGAVLMKAEGEPSPYEVPGVRKGMGIDEVLPRFLRNFFPGSLTISKSAGVGAGGGGCGLCGGRH